MKTIDVSAIDGLDFGATLTGAESDRMREQIAALRACREARLAAEPPAAQTPEKKEGSLFHWFVVVASGTAAGVLLSACLQML